MFYDCITQTPFISAAADYVFNEKITGWGFDSDMSLVSTLRALLFERIPDGERLSVEHVSFRKNSTGISDGSIVNSILCDLDNETTFTDEGHLIIYNIRTSVDGGKTINCLNKHFVETAKETGKGDDWECLEKVGAFFKTMFHCTCFLRPSRKTSIVFVENMNYSYLHYLQRGIIAAVPWYFDKSKGITELERKLLDALKEPTSTAYYEVLEEMILPYKADINKRFIETSLRGIENTVIDEQIRRQRSRINDIERQINSYLEYIASYTDERNQAQAMLFGLENGKKADNDIMDYFMTSKALKLVGVYDKKITFDVKSYLRYYDEECLETLLNNPNSVIYRSQYAAEGIKAMLKAIFIDEKYSIKICARYRISLIGGVEALSSTDFGAEFKNFMPNPHIQYYSCLGNHARAIADCISRGAYIGSIEQCVASASSLNWTDTTVINRFISDLYDNRNKKFIEAEDGRILSPIEVLAEIGEQAAEE